MTVWIGRILVVLCLVFFGRAIFTGLKILAALRGTPVWKYWLIQVCLVLLFAAGYASFLAFESWDRGGWDVIVVVALFVFGASYVVGSHEIGLATIKVVRRAAVLEVEANTDALTSLRNRRYLDRRLEEEVARARRYGLALSVLLLDIDHFKRVNDERGHRAGDRVLATVGRFIAAETRAADVAARYGGEELVVLATSTGVDGARSLAERLRVGIEALEYDASGESAVGEPLRCTVSVGVAALGPGRDTVDTLVEGADRALYQAKSAGRNCVVVHEPED